MQDLRTSCWMNHCEMKSLIWSNYLTDCVMKIMWKLVGLWWSLSRNVPKSIPHSEIQHGLAIKTSETRVTTAVTTFWTLLTPTLKTGFLQTLWVCDIIALEIEVLCVIAKNTGNEITNLFWDELLKPLFQYMSDRDADFSVLLRSGRWEMRGSLSSNSYRYNAICQFGESKIYLVTVNAAQR